MLDKLEKSKKKLDRRFAVAPMMDGTNWGGFHLIHQ
jgi:hypothetical protein